MKKGPTWREAAKGGADRRRHGRAGRGGERGVAWPAVLFFLRFVALWLAALLAISWVPGIEALAIRNTASALGAVVSVLAPDARTEGADVSARGLHFEIVGDCTPLMPAIVLAAACLSFPARWRWRLAGVLGGSVVLWIYNQLRLVVLFAVGWQWPAAFEFVHVYLWQTFTLIVVFLLFVAWLRLQSSPATESRAATERRPDEPGRLRRDSASPEGLRR